VGLRTWRSGGTRTRVVSYHHRFCGSAGGGTATLALALSLAEKWASWKGFAAAHVGPQGRSGRGKKVER
jgi:hypothetical protein